MFFECWKTFMLPMQFFIHSLLHPSLVAVNGNEKKRARTSTAERAQLYPRVSYSFYMRDTNNYNWRERGRKILYVWDRLFLLCTFLLLLSALSEHTYILFTSVILFVVLFIEGFVSFPNWERQNCLFSFFAAGEF